VEVLGAFAGGGFWLLVIGYWLFVVEAPTIPITNNK
jgi:hypothetical protein